MKLATFILTLFVGLLGACASNVPVTSVGERYTATDDDQAYRLGAGDRLRVTVYNEPSLSGEFQVSTDGKLSVPLIGDVVALGRTPTEVTEEIRTRLADGYLREPRVAGEITTYRPFFILGEVSTPGQYPYASGLTVLNAIATAQGFTPRAERNVVHIRRFGSSEEVAYRLTPDLRVRPGDTIRLGERLF